MTGNMGKRLLVTILFSAVLMAAAAQEYWMQPIKFFLSKGERLMVRLTTGENFRSELLSIKKTDVLQVMQHHGGKSIDVSDSLKENDRDQLTLTMSQEGTQLLSLHFNEGVKEISGENFNAYLKENGLDEILEARKNVPLANVKENSSHFMKLIIQVGEKRDETF